MQYADKMESSKLSLQDLLGMSNAALSSQFSMKKAHLSRFIIREKSTLTCANENFHGRSINGSKKIGLRSLKSQKKLSSKYDASNAKSTSDLKLNEGKIFKGIVSAKPAGSRLFACVQPPRIVEDVAPYSSIANTTVQKKTSEYKAGVEGMVAPSLSTMKASDMWKEKAVVLLCIRRPG